ALTPKEWQDHCVEHYDAVTSTKRYRIVFEKTLVKIPGFCPVCLHDDSLAFAERMKQFWDSDVHIKHIITHIKYLAISKETTVKPRYLQYIENDLTKAGMMTTQKWERVVTNFADIVVLVAKVAEMSLAPKARHLVKLFMELSADCACRAGELVYSSEYRNSTERERHLSVEGLMKGQSAKPVVIHEEPIGGFGVSYVVSLISLGIHQDVFAHPVTLERIYDPA
ncbi:hypothetical protein HDV05_005069, partial [Chytridiales sp. JEL 0842]